MPTSSNLIYTIPFCCPECKRDLLVHPREYKCRSCNKSYPIINNIPIFYETPLYYGEIAQSKMLDLLSTAKNETYNAAIKKHLKDPFVSKYVTDESRAKWIDIIPHDHNTTFVDVGCGWGTNSIPISRKVKILLALDFRYERVEFVQIRASQSNVQNVVPIVGSATKLPLPNSTFDVVAFNGVLEWVGAIDKDIDPISIQGAVLSEAHRILTDNGIVYIGIENRFSLRYFLGQPDDHTFIRFTSLLPRKVSNIYHKLRKGEKYYMHTHSLNRYHKLLTSCGFRNIKTYLPWPNYRNPDSIIELQYKQIINLCNELLTDNTISIRKKMYLKILKIITTIERRGRFCHSFCFVANK